MKPAQSKNPEPVAWLEISPSGGRNAYAERGEGITADDLAKGWQYIPLYTAPPQRKEWVGLTDEDMQGCIKTADYRQGQYKRTPYWAHLASAIEAKLREKNG